MTTTSTTVPQQERRLTRALRGIEILGNKLPHPFWLFWILFAVVAVLSAVLHGLGVTVADPATGEPVAVVNALSASGVRDLIDGAEKSFVTFSPLGTILVIMLGLAVADRAGLLHAVTKRSLARVGPTRIVFAVCLIGALSKFLSYSAYVIVIPLAAIAFRAVGRSPALGMIVAFLSINAAGDANPFIAPSDVVFADIATEAARIVDPDAVVRATDNTYFTTVSALVLAVVLTLVTEKVLAKREHELVADEGATGPSAPRDLDVSPAQERRALRWTGVVALAYAALLTAGMLLPGSPLRGPEGQVLDSPFFNNIALVLSLLFFLVGTTYAALTKQITSSSDLPTFMADGLKSISSLVVLFFAVAMFLELFQSTGISTVVAVEGAHVLEELNAPVPVVLLALVAGIAVLNLLITSGTALWALLAPVVIPATQIIGANPATVMAVYRIADSCTNSITPMSSTFILTVGYLQTLRKSAGIGTLISFTLPAAFAMLVTWTLLFGLWYALGIPLGPGSPVR